MTAATVLRTKTDQIGIYKTPGKITVRNREVRAIHPMVQGFIAQVTRVALITGALTLFSLGRR